MTTSYYESFYQETQRDFHDGSCGAGLRHLSHHESEAQRYTRFLISNTDYKEVSFWASRPEFTDSHVVFQNDDNYLDIMFENILKQLSFYSYHFAHSFAETNLQNYGRFQSLLFFLLIDIKKRALALSHLCGHDDCYRVHRLFRAIHLTVTFLQIFLPNLLGCYL